MSEVLTIFLYMLVCRELGQPPNFPGNATSWNLVDDNSYAPSLADLSVWAVSHDNCKDEAFNHVNGDVFVWRYIWQDIAAYFGLEVGNQKLFYFPACVAILIKGNYRSPSKLLKRLLVIPSILSNGPRISVLPGSKSWANMAARARRLTGALGDCSTGPLVSPGQLFPL